MQHEVLPKLNMAEAKVTLRSGEVFVFKNENNGANSKSMKDLISSVRYIQSKINDKLTEIVNDEKERACNKDLKDEENGEEYQSDSDENDEPAVKKRKTES